MSSIVKSLSSSSSSSSSLSSPYLLFIKTKDGHSFKVLSELIQKYVKDGCFIIDKTGINLTGVDTKTQKGTKLIYVNLPRHNFTRYITPEEPLNIGINMVHFYRMLKSIRKKDNVLSLYIFKNDPHKLNIQINQIGENDNKGIISELSITNIRPIIREKPEGYDDPIIITNKEFQKIKTLNKISKSIVLTKRNGFLELFSDKVGVYSKKLILGESNENEENDEVEEYKQTFESEQLLDLAKTANTSSNIQIYTTPDLPLHIKLTIGSLGMVDVYIKSKEHIDEENEDEEHKVENLLAD